MSYKMSMLLRPSLLFGTGKLDPRPRFRTVRGTLPVVVDGVVVLVSRRPIPVTELPPHYVVPEGCLVQCGTCGKWFVSCVPVEGCESH